MAVVRDHGGSRVAPRCNEGKVMAESIAIEWFVRDQIGVLRCANPEESEQVRHWLGRAGFRQVATVRPWPFTMAWRLPESGLRNVMFRVTGPEDLVEWDLFRLNEFCLYELAYGRRVPLWFEDARVGETLVTSIRRFFEPGLGDLDAFVAEMMPRQRQRLAVAPKRPARPTGCTYCDEGVCQDDLACHATDIEGAMGIVRSGRILSACRARAVSGEEMAQDARNAAGDPPDYFDYVMWASGNCTAVDKLVLERVVGHVPSWEEFEANFQPGVRFFFRSADLRGHPCLTFDGIHFKIRDELAVEPYLVLMVIPEDLPGSRPLVELARQRLSAEMVASSSFAGLHFREWARMVYRKALARGQA